MKAQVRILLMLLFAFAAVQPLFAQEGKVVQVTGMAEIQGDNKMAAKDAALRDAMRKAVETGLGTLIESQTLVENFALVNDRIYSQAKGFVSDYQILSEKEDHGSYVVAISATVNTAKLGDDLRAIGMLQDLVGKPKMMVMIDEFWWDPALTKAQQTPVDDPASAATLTSAFLDKGFYNMVDADMVKQLRSQEMMLLEDLMNDPEGLNELAKKAAADYGAEILVLGTCKAEPVSVDGGKYTASATLDVKIVDASTGALLSRKNVSQGGAGISPEGARSASGGRAAQAIADDVISQVLNFWQNKSNNGQDYIVKLYNVTSYARQGLKFLNGLKGVGGVMQANKRLWDEKLQRMEIAVTFKGGTVDDLTDAILTMAMDLPGFENIDLRSATGNNLNFYLP
ncbi:MAG: hypothetical protein H6678_06755 [Candidatus Delongbacteria bacterium]|nr:hypothetical protein [Candidatus Cloacimonadota bacterium]MCB9473492.1 hypothetical protein [Candidatus Delongbacteria bacterium]